MPRMRPQREERKSSTMMAMATCSMSFDEEACRLSTFEAVLPK